MTARTIRINQQALAETQRANRASEERQREAQVTDRYTKAVEQLGSEKLDVRLGGVYALERIAVDSERDHPTVVEVLSAFVRETTNPNQVGEPSFTEMRRGRPRPRADIQAAITVLGRLPWRHDVSRGDLSDAYLCGARLSGANLSDARLIGADLSHARLIEANLSHARLIEACLSDCELGGADLSSAELDRADLSTARLGGADLSGARLSGANLCNARLRGANLSGAGITQAQVDRAIGDQTTQLPDPLQRPASWLK